MSPFPLPLPAENSLGALRLSVSTASIEHTLHAIYLKVFLGCILVVLIAALATLFVSRKISRPLEEMKKGAERLARGDTDSLLAIDTANMSTEMSALARTLNRMAKQIRERINTITLQHNELETVFASMAEMVLAINTDKKNHPH